MVRIGQLMCDEDEPCCFEQGFLAAFHAEVNCDCECHDWRDFGEDD